MPNDIKAFLTKKIGPLPAGVWLGVIGVALYVKHRSSVAAASAPADTTTTTTDSSVDPNTGLSYASGSGPPPYTPGYGSGDGTYGALPPINITVQEAAAPVAKPGGLTAHQLHLLHLQHIGNGPTPKPALTAHQLHLLHLQHLANTRR